MVVFSIITCTYNAESVLQRTLDSVLEQTYSHVEHIIVDGASTDATLDMVEAYKQKSDAEDIAETPQASPSSPSLKFIAFVSPTIQRIVIGIRQTPNIT